MESYAPSVYVVVSVCEYGPWSGNVDAMSTREYFKAGFYVVVT